MPLLSMHGISKTFPGVRALDDVDFDLQTGEIHALVGENGAGKSTLLRVLGGAHPAGSFDGRFTVDGRPARFRSVRDAEAAGIAVVYQELSVVGPLSVAENIALGREPSRFGVIDRESVRNVAARAAEALHVTFDLEAPVERLGVGRQQLVEIAKALARDARILVLDEPTAALTDADVDSLFEVLRRLRARGIGIIYVSHRLAEVFGLADRVTVLRDGKSVASEAIERLNEGTVVSMMVGRTVDMLYPPAGRPSGQVVLAVDGLSVEDPHAWQPSPVWPTARPTGTSRYLVRDVSLRVHAGEVVGIGGLIGAGRTELLLALVGAVPGRRIGTISIDGAVARIESPADALRNGVVLLTEDRARLGLYPDRSVIENLTLAALGRIAGRFVTSPARERDCAVRTLGDLRVKVSNPSAPAGTLSGGNQQKVLLGRALLTTPKVLLLDEPTRGVDIGAREEIYTHIDRLARAGLGIVVVSSDLSELIGLSDRVLVLREGNLVAEFDRLSVSPERVMSAAAGGGAADRRGTQS
jgi:D-xylose transport system ATP-binding protein